MTKKNDFNSRWGNAIADDYQYCHVPGYILRNYSKCVSVVDVLNDNGEIETKRGQIIDLDMQDMMFVVHIMAFKYDAPNGKASPGLPTIAEYTGLHVTSIRRIKQKLMSFGLLSVKSEIGRPDVYSFSGLHDQCVRLEQELEPIEGVPVTPSKSASGSKNARGWASKNARGTPSKSATRRVKGNSEEKKEKVKRAPSKKKDYTIHDAIINTWATVRNLNAIKLGASVVDDDSRKTVNGMAFWASPPSEEEITYVIQHSKRRNDYRLSWLSDDIKELRITRSKPVAINPAHVPFPASDFTGDEYVPRPDEAADALKLLAKTVQVKDEVQYAKPA